MVSAVLRVVRFDGVTILKGSRTAEAYELYCNYCHTGEMARGKVLKISVQGSDAGAVASGAGSVE